MADEFKYNLVFQSTATGTGAKETAAALDGVDDANRRVQASTGRTVAEFAAQGAKAKVSEFAFYDLDKAIRKTDASNATFTAGTSAVKKGTTDASRSLLLFSQGFEDAQYGIRGVMNNIPSLVLSLGGTAGLAGAISIAAVAGSVLFDWLSKTEEKASDVADRVKEISENMADVTQDVFDAVGASIEADAAAAKAAKQTWDESRKAEAEFSTSVLSNAEKIALAQRNIAEALGQEVNHRRELEAIAARAAAARKLAADQAIAAERDREAKSGEAVTEAGDALQVARQRAEIEGANLLNLRAELQALRDKRDELEKIAKQRVVSDDPGAQVLSDIFPSLAKKTPAGKAAESQLADPAFQASLAGQQARVDRLEELVRRLGDEGSGAVATAENALTAAEVKQADIQRAVATNIQRISETLEADTLVAQSETLVASQKQLATDLQSAVKNVEVSTAQGLAAKDVILAATADGQLTANEVRGVSDGLRTLMGQLQAGLAGTTGNVQALIQLVAGLQETTQRQQTQINALGAKK